MAAEQRGQPGERRGGATGADDDLERLRELFSGGDSTMSGEAAVAAIREVLQSEEDLTSGEEALLQRLQPDVVRRFLGGDDLSSEEEQLLKMLPMEKLKEKLGIEDEDLGRSRFFTRDQLVHEAAIMVRGMYGQTKIDPVGGGRDEELGFYDLLDAWLVTAQRLDRKFHSDFLKYATKGGLLSKKLGETGLGWERKLHRRFPMPYYFIIARDGVDRAIREEYVSPFFKHKYKYLLAAHYVPPIGAPIGWASASIGMSPREALVHAEMMEDGEATSAGFGGDAAGGSLTSQAQYLYNELNSLQDDIEVKKTQIGQISAEMKRADLEGDTEAYEKFKEEKERIEAEIQEKEAKRDRLQERYEALKSRSQKERR